ncbi:MAG: MFS transporter [Lactobacillaceae bacterium]|nr:MFS transporter [Lactobacillaceae bacterium]
MDNQTENLEQLQNQTMDTKVSKTTILSIVAVALLGFMGILTETSMNVTFTELTKEFNLSLGIVQWLTTGYLLVVALIMTTSAYFKTAFSDKRIFLYAISAFFIGDIIAIIAPNFWPLLLGRLIQAIGTGMAMPLLFNIILQRVPKSHLGQWMGFAGLILSLAPALGPSYGGLMQTVISWRGIFIVALPIAIVSLILGMIYLDNEKPFQRDGSNHSFDFKRFILLGTALTSSLLALNQLENGGFTAWFYGLVGLTIITFAWFILASKNATKKYIDIEVFKTRSMVYALIIYAVVQAITLAVNFVLPQFAQLSLHTTTLVAGLVLMPGSILGSALNPLVGIVYDKFGSKYLMIIGNIGFTIFLGLFAFFTSNMTATIIWILYLLMTISRNPVFTSANTGGLAEVDLRFQADANAIFTTSQQFAGAMGTTIGSLFLQVKGSNIALQTEIGTRNFFIFVTVVAALMFIAINRFLANKTSK